MADVMQLLTGVRSFYWTPTYALVLVCLLFWTSYRLIARIFKWLTLALFAYIAAAVLAHPDWPAVVRATLIPHVQWTGAYWATLVGILGTTISPYLFFWQAAQEVEEDIASGKSTVALREGASNRELRRLRNDVVTGMFFSNLVMYFIILTAAATMHAHGKTTISTLREAAEALRPLAGAGAYWLFSPGLLGGGMAPPLLVLVVLLTSRADVMGEHRNGAVLSWLGWTCAAVMLIATVIMLATASAA